MTPGRIMDLNRETPFGAADDVTIAAVPLAVIRHEGVTFDQLAPLFDTGYAVVAHLFADGTAVPAGPALAVYYGDPMSVFTLEIGFPIATALSAPLTVDTHTVVPSVLPPGPAVATTHVGPYGGLGAGWAALVVAADERGHAPRGIWIESYVSNPSDTPADRLRTDLIMPTGT